MPQSSAPEDGWERRFVAGPERAREAVELYAQAGFEVLAVPAEPEDLGDGCDSCPLVEAGRFRVIYTRRPGREA